MGYIGALSQLGLMNRVRYLGGISGGSWATTMYTYAQDIKEEEKFLGPIVAPSDIKHEDLKAMDPACARGFASKPLTLWCVQSWLNGTVDSISSGWAYSVWATYLEPVGITQNTRFSWTQETIDDIKARNPSLADETFLLPTNADRPYLIIATALLGPTSKAPYRPVDQNYSHIEITPMYVGNMRNQEIAYKDETRYVGGVIENYAFSRKSKTSTSAGVPVKVKGLAADQQSGTLNVPQPDSILDLAFSAGASGYAPGALMSSIGMVFMSLMPYRYA